MLGKILFGGDPSREAENAGFDPNNPNTMMRDGQLYSWQPENGAQEMANYLGIPLEDAAKMLGIDLNTPSAPGVGPGSWVRASYANPGGANLYRAVGTMAALGAGGQMAANALGAGSLGVGAATTPAPFTASAGLPAGLGGATTLGGAAAGTTAAGTGAATIPPAMTASSGLPPALRTGTQAASGGGWMDKVGKFLGSTPGMVAMSGGLGLLGDLLGDDTEPNERKSFADVPDSDPRKGVVDPVQSQYEARRLGNEALASFASRPKFEYQPTMMPGQPGRPADSSGGGDYSKILEFLLSQPR